MLEQQLRIACRSLELAEDAGQSADRLKFKVNGPLPYEVEVEQFWCSEEQERDVNDLIRFHPNRSPYAFICVEAPLNLLGSEC